MLPKDQEINFKYIYSLEIIGDFCVSCFTVVMKVDTTLKWAETSVEVAMSDKKMTNGNKTRILSGRRRNKELSLWLDESESLDDDFS